jgi:Cft2 family RNA processing exonuclease
LLRDQMYDYKTGTLTAGGARISLDDASGELCFVSHAHADHTSAFGSGKPIMASEETFAIAGRRAQRTALPQGISLHHAGHMLGARQLLAQFDGGTFAYTGDFSLHDSYTARAAEVLSCDTLMIDSTYCLPQMRFPKRYDVLARMERFVKQNSGSILLFGAYSTGKAQELVLFLNRECGVAPVVGSRASRVCAAYEKCGLRLDYLPAGSEEAGEEARRAHVAILPPPEVNFSSGALAAARLGRAVKTAVATGWAASSRFPVDEAFPLSDHADFSDTMHYVHSSGAKAVICANSNAGAAARYLRSIGVNAIEKGEPNPGVQATLEDLQA